MQRRHPLLLLTLFQLIADPNIPDFAGFPVSDARIASPALCAFVDSKSPPLSMRATEGSGQKVLTHRFFGPEFLIFLRKYFEFLGTTLHPCSLEHARSIPLGPA